MLTTTAEADTPASAIGWLSQIEITPPPVVQNQLEGIKLPDVEISPLGRLSQTGVGLRPIADLGLSSDAFENADPTRVALLFSQLQPLRIPHLDRFVKALLVAEFSPPLRQSEGNSLLIERIDALLRFAALEEAQALLEQADRTDRALFLRWFDVSLLTGHDAEACAALRAQNALSVSLPARVFCLSRTGDWMAAFLSLDTARALGDISADKADLLAYFLDPEAYEGEALPIVEGTMTPLLYRLYDGLGETPPSRGLSLSFSVADLRPSMGWKARLEAGERLAKVSSVSPEYLHSLYTERMPAASGGVWDRADAIQRLDVALEAQDPNALTQALRAAYAQMQSHGLIAILAELYGPQLEGLFFAGSQQGHARSIAQEMLLLSNAYEGYLSALYSGAEGEGPQDLASMLYAETLPYGIPARLARLHAALHTDPLNAEDQSLISQGRSIEILLESFVKLQQVQDKELDDVARQIARLRHLGLVNEARRTALFVALMGAPT